MSSSLADRLAKLEDRVDTLEIVSDSKGGVEKGKKDNKKNKKSKKKGGKRTGTIYYVDASPSRGDNTVHNSAVFRESLQRRLSDNYDIDCKLHDARHGEDDEDKPRGALVFTGSRPLGYYSKEEALRHLPASAHGLPLILVSSGNHYEGEIDGAHVVRMPVAHVYDNSALDGIVDNAAKVLARK